MFITAYVNRLATILRHPSNRGHWLEVARRTLALRLALAGKRPVEFSFVNGTRIRCWPDSFAGRGLAYYRVFDYPQMAFMQSFLRGGDSVLDVGANVGVYTVVSGTLVGPAGHVDAIEALPDTADLLAQNIALNGLGAQVTVHQLAVGSDDDSVEFTTTEDATNHMIAAGMPPQRDVVAATIRIPTGRLDDIATRSSYILGKIDIEGREWDAFRAAERLLAARTPPVWLVEVNGALFRYGHEVAPFVSWMGERGFDPFMYDPDSMVMRRVRQEVWGDVFFIARDQSSVVETRIPGLRFSD